jgi:hypothetical protein
VLSLLLTLAGAPGCRKRSLESSAEPARTASSVADQGEPLAPASTQDSGRLPEDPVAGERSVVQWRAHLVEEERERKLNYDRRRMKEHRAVLAFLNATRAGYDRASTPAAVLKSQKALAISVVSVRKRIEKIDPDGASSNVLADYSALLALLGEPYPAARIAAMSGDAAELTKVRAAFDAGIAKIAGWLEQAEEAEDEGSRAGAAI